MNINIYTSGDELPKGLLTDNFFHSPTLFKLSQNTPRHKPYMVTVEDSDGTVFAQLLALIRYRSSLFPPYFYMHCRVLGEGAYSISGETPSQQQLFGMMLERLRAEMSHRVLYIEVSNLSQKMYGYKEFRQNGFFPIRWMSIHNSLHSMEPSERLTHKTKQHISQAYQRGVITKEVETEEEFVAFSKLLRHHNWLKPKRYVPHDDFFRGISQTEHGRLFITKYRNHVIGCSALAYSQGQAYLWYSAFRRKSFRWVHPDEVTIWYAIQDAYNRGCEHIFFMDVGLPFSNNPFRDFILRFGGKPTSTYRWFLCNISWINRLFAWFYRE